jgi:hypothetical protein
MKYHDYVRLGKQEYLRWVLAQTKGDVTKAAKLADINRTFFYKLMERYEIPKKTSKDIHLKIRSGDTSVSPLLQNWRRSLCG